MNAGSRNLLVVGATGSIGRMVVIEGIREGYAVRALVRESRRAEGLPDEAQRIVGDLTKPQTLRAAVEGIDAIVFTHGASGGKAASEAVDYGGVRNVLSALAGRSARIALMTAIGVTQAGDPSDGVVARRQIAQVLVRSLASPAADHKTFELVAERGAEPDDFDALFAALDADPLGAFDAVDDTPNMPLAQEPERVRRDLAQLSAH
jgi:uncharacterized protein YbjT (DUF2867 family)